MAAQAAGDDSLDRPRHSMFNASPRQNNHRSSSVRTFDINLPT
jgi:hypothetical protein